MGYTPRPVPHVVALFPPDVPDLRSPYDEGLTCVLSHYCQLKTIQASQSEKKAIAFLKDF